MLQLRVQTHTIWEDKLATHGLGQVQRGQRQTEENRSMNPGSCVDICSQVYGVREDEYPLYQNLYTSVDQVWHTSCGSKTLIVIVHNFLEHMVPPSNLQSGGLLAGLF